MSTNHPPAALLLKAEALQLAIHNSANFSSIATDAQGVIQIFNVGAERMLGYKAEEMVDKITPAGISDAQELIARAATLSLELDTPITPGFEALVFKASRGRFASRNFSAHAIRLRSSGRNAGTRWCMVR